MPRLLRGARLRPQELEAWSVRRSEASHDHAASSERRYFASAGSLPKAPSQYQGPLGGAGWSSGASLGRPGGRGGPAVLPGLAGGSSGRPPPALCKPRAGCAEGLWIYRPCLLLQRGVGPLSGTPPLRSRRGLAWVGLLKTFFFRGRLIGDLLHFYRYQMAFAGRSVSRCGLF